MDITDWISKNASWLKPVASGAFDLVGNAVTSGRTNDYFDRLREAENRNYEQSKANYDAYSSWAEQNAASSRAAAAARAAVANRNDELRRQFEKKGWKQYKKHFNEAKGYLEPYRQAGTQLLPQMTKAYEGGLGALGNLLGQFQQPDRMNLMYQNTPAYNVNIPLPDYLKGK